MTHYRCIHNHRPKLRILINTSCRGKYVYYDPQTNIHLGKGIVKTQSFLLTILLCKLGCLNYVSLLKITGKTYPNVPSSLQKEDIFIAVTLKIYANSSVHTPPQYSVAKDYICP